MKQLITLLPIFLFILAGCDGSKQSNTQKNDLITVDVTASYPKKDLIVQDFMDVEYIPLETNDDFLCQGGILAIGKQIMLIQNFTDDGDIFIFDRSGKAIRKINRKGNGGEEYNYYYEVVLDEDNGEVFISDNSKQKTFVYDLYGNFKRFLKHKEETKLNFTHNFDEKSFIWVNSFFDYNDNPTVDIPSFFITSKQDGSVIEEIRIPYEKKKSLVLIKRDENSNMVYTTVPPYSSILQDRDQIILLEPSSDTIYSYSSDHKLSPLMARTPSVQSMNPEVFLLPVTLTDRYCFMETLKMEYDFATNSGFQTTDLIYDKQEKAIYEYKLFNGDYANKKQIELSFRTIDEEIVNCQRLEASSLLEASGKGELQGKLKEIAATLDDESNPVIMLIKHKK